MKSDSATPADDGLRNEYNAAVFAGAVRGKYASKYSEGSNLILLAPDVARAFPSSEAVNQALRLLMQVAETTAARLPQP